MTAKKSTSAPARKTTAKKPATKSAPRTPSEMDPQAPYDENTFVPMKDFIDLKTRVEDAENALRDLGKLRKRR